VFVEQPALLDKVKSLISIAEDFLFPWHQKKMRQPLLSFLILIGSWRAFNVIKNGYLRENRLPLLSVYG
jgi:hypothetical protein